MGVGRLHKLHVAVPYWLVALSAALPPALWAARRAAGVRRRRRAASAGLCPRCGYDLTGNVSGVCPECGAGAKAILISD